MEDFNKKESRKALTAELEVQKNYLELVPRPSDEDYQRLKENIARNGFDDANPIAVTENLVVLDGHTRLQIAKELGEEWVYVITKDLEDHYAEKLYIIERNLLRRHLTTGQRIELGKKLLEIKKEEARERQLRNLKQNQNITESIILQASQCANDEQFSERGYLENETLHTVPQVLAEREEKGEAIELTASQIEINKETFRQGLKIMEAAETDPEIAEDWGKVIKGKATVNHVYQKVQQKKAVAPKKRKKQKISRQPQCTYVIREKPPQESYFKRMTKYIPPRPPKPDHVIMAVIYGLAEKHGISREEMDAAIAWERSFPFNHGESYIVQRFRWWSTGELDAEVAWSLCLMQVDIWRKQQRSLRPEEAPVPDNSKKLGPWALDFVHQAQLEDLVREFPSGSVHMIYSDALMEDLDQLSLLGEFAARTLNHGKYLCVYVDKRHLPEAMARLTAAGLTYFWTCMVFRPLDKVEVQGRMMRDKCHLLLIYRKGEASEGEWDWFDDAVEERRPSNRGMIRQLLKGLTIKGQMVVDPFVGSGVTGQAARSLGRRFLCFGAEEEDVRAANQRIAELRLAEEGASTTT